MNVRCFVVVAALALTSCGGPPAPTTSGPTTGSGTKTNDPGPSGIVPVGDVSPDLLMRCDRAFRVASRVRGLKPKEKVKLSVLPPSELVAIVKKKVSVDIPKDLIQGEGRMYAALGLIPPSYDYENETYALLEEELAGLYVPEDKTMYVAKGMSSNDLDLTLVHEFVHALQDQHFGIGDRMKFKPGEGDSIAAVHALAEGDATSAMYDALILAEKGEEVYLHTKAFDVIPPVEPEDLLDSELGGSSNKKKKTSKLATTPRFLALGLLAPYADGMRFVHAMRHRGGFKAVDQAWSMPPKTTEQLLHVDKYDKNEAPIDVPTITANALGPAFKKTFDDSFGEQEGRLAFTQWMDRKASKSAAAGWGGDRVVLYEDATNRAVAWRIVFDDEEEAREAFGHLSMGWAAAYYAPALNQAGGKSEALQVWGPVPQAKKDEPKKTDPKDPKDPKKKDGKLPPLPPTGAGTLPPLPDAPGVTSGSTAIGPGCRALKQAGRAVTVLAGVPCTAVVAWAAEAGKAP